MGKPLRNRDPAINTQSAFHLYSCVGENGVVFSSVGGLATFIPVDVVPLNGWVDLSSTNYSVCYLILHIPHTFTVIQFMAWPYDGRNASSDRNAAVPFNHRSAAS